jgi:hypothetical protein
MGSGHTLQEQSPSQPHSWLVPHWYYYKVPIIAVFENILGTPW